MDQKKMEPENSYKEIKSLISEGEVKTAIDKLKSLNKFDDIDQISARYNNLQKENIKGTLSHSDYTIELNRITDALLKMINSTGETERRSKNKILYMIIGALLLMAGAYAFVQLFPAEDGLMLMEEDGKYGYKNKNGAVVIPAQYEMAKDFVDTTAVVGMGDYTWRINKKGNCVMDCENIVRYEKSIRDKKEYAAIMSQILRAEEEVRKQCKKYEKWIGDKVMIGESAKRDLLKDVEHIKFLYDKALEFDSVEGNNHDSFFQYWRPIEKQIKEAYLPNPDKWYKIQFPGFGNNFIAVLGLKENELLRVSKNPSKESFYRFKFIPRSDFKGWYYIQTVDNYYWHCIKRPSTYTDSGIHLVKRNKKSITETFVIDNIGDGKITLKGEGHDATGGRKQGVLSISQVGNNKRPDKTPLHLWEYLKGGDQQLRLVEVK